MNNNDPIPSKSSGNINGKVSQADLNTNRQKIDDVIADVMKGAQKAPVETHEQELVRKINGVTKEVYSEFSAYAYMKIHPYTRDEACEEVRKLYTQKYTTWSKDDLLEAFSMFLASMAVESLHAGGKII